VPRATFRTTAKVPVELLLTSFFKKATFPIARQNSKSQCWIFFLFIVIWGKRRILKLKIRWLLLPLLWVI